MKSFFINNRRKLINEIEDMSLVVVAATKPLAKSSDEHYEFSPNRNFYYLTGISEPNDILIITKINNVVTETLLIRENDELTTKWTGSSFTKEEASCLSGINNIKYLDDNLTALENIVKVGNLNNLYLDTVDFNLHPIYHEITKHTNNLNKKELYPILVQLRMVKEPFEVEMIKKANEITTIGINNILKNIKPNTKEYVAESYFDQAIKANGASGFAFRTIAAGGKNACVLHYDSNNANLNENELILFDLGAEYDYYKSDVSRTIPISGTFTPRQKVLYNIVLEAQKLVINCAKPGLTTKDLNDLVIDFYAVELKKIGLIDTKEEVSKYYYHGVSHHLGLDTHDISTKTPLTEGCVITVEPGLYIEEEQIGIRIEDDILITKDGCLNLTTMIKEVKDIELLMKNNNR